MNKGQWEDDEVYIVSVGAQTPVGRSALKAAAAVRCGISAYQEHPFMIDQHGEPMIVALAEWLPVESTLVERTIRLSVDAVSEVMQGMQALTGDELPLMTSMSTSTFPEAEDQHRVMLGIRAELAQQGLNVAPQIFVEGNAAGVVAVKQAVERLQSGDVRAIIVLGVDSHLAPELLEKLDESGRLHSINNSWGFTPGEGAGAMFLTTGRTLHKTGLVPLAHVGAVAVGKESKLLGTKTVCIGEGLTAAFQGALSADDKVCHSYCDLNGETYRADEFGFAVCRSQEGFHDAGSFNAPAECWGDVGAASAPLQVALATSAWSRRYAKGTSVLCWSSSTTSPLRGAIRLKNSWHQVQGSDNARHN